MQARKQGAQKRLQIPKRMELKPQKSKSQEALVQVEFEVFGDIQGVYFTKYAKDTSERLGLKGWMKWSRRGTLMGLFQGEKAQIDQMAYWLRLQGSPGSRIHHTDFRNFQFIDSLDYKTFSLRF